MADTSDAGRSILRERLAAADIAVSGRVTSVRDVPVPKLGITEHDPLWRELYGPLVVSNCFFLGSSRKLSVDHLRKGL